jgi:fucose permease
MRLVERRYAALYWGVLANFLWFGISFTAIGAVLPRLIQDFGWSYTESGVTLAAAPVGFFLSTFLCGFLLKRFGLQAVMTAGLLIHGAGCLPFGLYPSVAANSLALFLIGVGQGAIEVAVNTAVVRMERPGEHHLMSFVHAAFSVGAVAGPLAVGVVLTAGLPWQWVYRGLAAAFLAAALAQLLLPYRRVPDSRAVPGAPRRGGGVRPLILLGAAITFLYVGIEVGLSNWSAEYAVAAFAMDSRLASFMVSLFWLGLLAGRLAIPVLARRVPLPAQLLILSLFTALALFGLVLARRVTLAIPGFLLAGIGCSSIYPLVITIVGQRLGKQAAVGVGILSTGSGLGSFNFPFAMALVADRFGLRAGFLFLAATGLALVAVSAALGLRIRGGRGSAPAPGCAPAGPGPDPG